MADNSSKKKEIEQLINSEKKYQSFIQRRNELNDLAKVLREERDMINSMHKEIKESMQKAKTERNIEKNVINFKNKQNQLLMLDVKLKEEFLEIYHCELKSLMQTFKCLNINKKQFQ